MHNEIIICTEITVLKHLEQIMHKMDSQVKHIKFNSVVI